MKLCPVQQFFCLYAINVDNLVIVRHTSYHGEFQRCIYNYMPLVSDSNKIQYTLWLLLTTTFPEQEIGKDRIIAIRARLLGSTYLNVMTILNWVVPLR